ncbi:HTH-type transcriptional regulator DegA [Koleobacter methoxysyntrophicus]|uniref:HTH-type transcriptional regulator DegA n=2 Tax=Koleobacter methoxysyntrophicus TaxID=2751313 RepID=A0A8A0RM19_9FIRM|nr:HTH-type transcriptional regulator DegA [Koleobacter methoxysyntrophicus]
MFLFSENCKRLHVIMEVDAMSKTIYDVAKKAGVSIATVSRVLNKKDNVSDETKKRVLNAIKELDYVPNMVASALMTKKMFTLSLLIPDISNPYFSEIARGVEDAANNYNYNVIVCNTDYDLKKEAIYLNLLRQKSVDGFIVSSATYNDENICNFDHKKYPLVLLGREIEGAEENKKIDIIVSNNVCGGYLATEHLIELGHRKIDLILGPKEIKVNQEREKGYRKALQDYEITVDENRIHSGEFKIKSGYSKALEILQKKDRPTAIFAGSDVIAIGVLKAARVLGFKVPGDLSVVGYDNTILAEIADPPLTTINQQMYRMGYLAAEMLIKRLRGAKRPIQRIVFDTELVVRKSSSRPR